MRQVQSGGCGRGTHGGGLSFSELQDVVQILKAGAVGASGEAQGLCVCLASQVPRIRRKLVPREDYGVGLLSPCSLDVLGSSVHTIAGHCKG
jgi:hypothetical protein